ncbi:DUF6274 family protein [Streptomyces thermocarboxydus]
MTASARHETRALLRAHLAAASSYRHLTRQCPVCHRLQRLAMDSAGTPRPSTAPSPSSRQNPSRALRNKPPPRRVPSSAYAVGSTTQLVCDGCHRMSFHKGGTYASPTTGQFNMCNCTPRVLRPDLSGADPTDVLRLRQARAHKGVEAVRTRTRTHHRRTKDRAGPGGVQRDRRRTRCSVGCEALIRLGERAVGAVPASLGAKVPGRRGRWGPAGSARFMQVQASLRCCGMPASSARTSASR